MEITRFRQLGFFERILFRALGYLIYRSLRQAVSRPELHDMVRKELQEVRANLIAFDNYQMEEAQVLTDRLGRRYDPGMALSEATKRALLDKGTARKAAEVKLTGTQLAALKVQEEYLKRIVRQS